MQRTRNNKIPYAIAYYGNEDGIDALIIDEKLTEIENTYSSFEKTPVQVTDKGETSTHSNEEKHQNPKSGSVNIVLMVIGICVIAVVVYFIVQKKSESTKHAEELNERIIQDSILAANTALERMVDSTAQASAMQKTLEETEKQSCSFDQLSRIYDYELKLLPAEENTPAFLELNIIDKVSKNVLKSLTLKTGGMYFFDCKARSYVTGFNKDETVADGDYGSLIIQDFNFDELEDIAVKTESANSGARYNFYLQSKNNNYISDSFLTDSVRYFPNLNPKTKTLNLSVPVGSEYVSEKNYQYDSIAGWKLLSDTVRAWDN